jgi:hypothetical protein
LNRRNFLRLSALLVPTAVVEPRRVYSFIWAPPARVSQRALAAFLAEQLDHYIRSGLISRAAASRAITGMVRA